MARTTNKVHARRLQNLIRLIGDNREPFAETGRKFDKVYADDKVMFFVARMDMPSGIKAGDIYGRKTNQAPNLHWFFGNLKNVEKWDWSDPRRPKPVSDDSVVVGKKYGTFSHYVRVPGKE